MRRSMLNTTMLFLVLCCGLGLIWPGRHLAQEKTMTITTTSEQALQYFLQGREKMEWVQVKESAEAFNHALNLDPEFALAHLYRYTSGVGSLEKRQAHLDKAVALKDKVSPGEKLLIEYSLASQARDIGKLRELVKSLQALLPEDKRVLDMAGMFYHYTERDYASALRLYQKAIALDADFAPTYNNLGYCHMAMQQFADAEKAFLRQIELIPNQANPYDSYAELLQKMGRYEDSIAQYKLALEKDPAFALALSGIGGNYLLMKAYDKAAYYYERWFEETPYVGNRFTALDKLMAVHLFKGEFDAALKVNQRYLALAKAHDRPAYVCRAHMGDGFVFGATGKIDDALCCYQKTMDLAKSAALPDAVKANFIRSSRYATCLVLLEGKRLDEAVPKVEQLRSDMKLKEHYGDAKFLHILDGHVAAQQGAYEKALNHYKQSWTESALTKWYMVEAYRQLDKQTEVDRLLKEIDQAKETDFETALVQYRVRAQAGH